MKSLSNTIQDNLGTSNRKRMQSLKQRLQKAAVEKTTSTNAQQIDATSTNEMPIDVNV